MKKILLIIIFCLGISPILAQEIAGKWMTDDGEAVVEIYKTANKINGKIVWLKKSQDHNGNSIKDFKNPESTKRNQPVVGLVIFSDFKEKDGKWQDGKIYNPDDGKTYKSSLWLEKDKLKVGGYIGIFYQTQTLTRK